MMIYYYKNFNKLLARCKVLGLSDDQTTQITYISYLDLEYNPNLYSNNQLLEVENTIRTLKFLCGQMKAEDLNASASEEESEMLDGIQHTVDELDTVIRVEMGLENKLKSTFKLRLRLYEDPEYFKYINDIYINQVKPYYLLYTDEEVKEILEKRNNLIDNDIDELLNEIEGGDYINGKE